MGGDWRRHLRGWVESARPFWNRFDARSFDLQLFAFDPEQEREKIKSGYYSKTVSPQKQARHIEGTKEYERYCKALEETEHTGKQGRKPIRQYSLCRHRRIPPSRRREHSGVYQRMSFIIKGANQCLYSKAYSP